MPKMARAATDRIVLICNLPGPVFSCPPYGILPTDQFRIPKTSRRTHRCRHRHSATTAAGITGRSPMASAAALYHSYQNAPSSRHS